ARKGPAAPPENSPAYRPPSRLDLAADATWSAFSRHDRGLLAPETDRESATFPQRTRMFNRISLAPMKRHPPACGASRVHALAVRAVRACSIWQPIAPRKRDAA